MGSNAILIAKVEEAITSHLFQNYRKKKSYIQILLLKHLQIDIKQSLICKIEKHIHN